jgi:hypothetical protein
MPDPIQDMLDTTQSERESLERATLEIYDRGKILLRNRRPRFSRRAHYSGLD